MGADDGAMAGGPITTVAPSTTAAALTSITTGLPPGAHGVVGYRIRVEGEVLNILRWQASGRDARATIPPDKVQVHEPFAGHRPPVVTRAEFRETGFTQAHLDRHPAGRVAGDLHPRHRGRRSCCGRGEPFVYAYYEGIDKVAHEYGLGEFYDAELPSADRIVADLIEVLPAGAVLVVTSDHGQVDVGEQHHHPGAGGHGPRRRPVGRGALPLAARPSRPRPAPARGGDGAPRRHRVGRLGRPGRRRATGSGRW